MRLKLHYIYTKYITCMCSLTCNPMIPLGYVSVCGGVHFAYAAYVPLFAPCRSVMTIPIVHFRQDILESGQHGPLNVIKHSESKLYLYAPMNVLFIRPSGPDWKIQLPRPSLAAAGKGKCLLWPAEGVPGCLPAVETHSKSCTGLSRSRG